jgi:hypothetical protein
VCGSTIAFVPGIVKEFAASLFSLLLMLFEFYIHFTLNDPFEQMVPAFIFTLLILTRFIIWNQANKREKNAEMEEEKSARIKNKDD